MRKLVRLLLFVVVLLALLALVVASRDPVRSGVSVTFLCYTNRDTNGMNDQYQWAWFCISNNSPYMLDCGQGSLDIERSGRWIQDTNLLGRHYDRIIEPGRSLLVSIMPPTDATRWRSSFLLTKIAIVTGEHLTRRYRLEAFMDSLRLERIGLRGRPWKGSPEPNNITSTTLDL
jgi:hypothetical protein